MTSAICSFSNNFVKLTTGIISVATAFAVQHVALAALALVGAALLIGLTWYGIHSIRHQRKISTTATDPNVPILNTGTGATTPTMAASNKGTIAPVSAPPANSVDEESTAPAPIFTPEEIREITELCREDSQPITALPDEGLYYHDTNYHRGSDICIFTSDPRPIEQGITGYLLSIQNNEGMSLKSLSDLVDLYAKGRDHKKFSQNLVKAMQLAKIGSPKGDDVSSEFLGLCYKNGYNGVPIDYNQAMIYFNLSLKQGNRHALIDLADCYENALGAAKDTIRAEKYRNICQQMSTAITMYFDEKQTKECLMQYQNVLKLLTDQSNQEEDQELFAKLTSYVRNDIQNLESRLSS